MKKLHSVCPAQVECFQETDSATLRTWCQVPQGTLEVCHVQAHGVLLCSVLVFGFLVCRINVYGVYVYEDLTLVALSFCTCF